MSFRAVCAVLVLSAVTLAPVASPYAAEEIIDPQNLPIPGQPAGGAAFSSKAAPLAPSYVPPSSSPLPSPVVITAPETSATPVPPAAALPPAPPKYGNWGEPEESPVAMRSGLELGVQRSFYQYREPDDAVDVTLRSRNLGVTGFTGTGTLVFGDSYFAAADLRYAFGLLDYRGTGTLGRLWNEWWDGRILFGKDFAFEEGGIAPYIGLGYRRLYDDNRGVTSANAGGYRRENQLYYLAFGIKPRIKLGEDTRLSATLEYDNVAHGEQKSWISDAGLGDPDIINVQRSGFGVRGDVMLEWGRWSIGPFFNVWSIGNSRTKTVVDNSSTTCTNFGLSAPCILGFVEPFNTTVETGLQMKIRLF